MPWRKQQTTPESGKKKSRKGFWKRKKNEPVEYDFEPQDSPTDVTKPPISRSGRHVITAQDGGKFPPSAVGGNRFEEDSDGKFPNSNIYNYDDGRPPSPMAPRREKAGINKKMVVLEKAPAAKDSAYTGPPRYDWIDIETSAAMKIQAIARRNQVLETLEKQGRTTARMRNRQRQRNAKRRDNVMTDDTPGFFRFCGLGLIFGDGTEKDEKLKKQQRLEAYREKRRQKEEEERRKREYHWRSQDREETVEGFEVVENFH